ncbi:hypothetical protein DV737_g5395, partial [Chaetothyriales sp. CBS 132003]
MTTVPMDGVGTETLRPPTAHLVSAEIAVLMGDEIGLHRLRARGETLERASHLWVVDQVTVAGLTMALQAGVHSPEADEADRTGIGVAAAHLQVSETEISFRTVADRETAGGNENTTEAGPALNLNALIDESEVEIEISGGPATTNSGREISPLREVSQASLLSTAPVAAAKKLLPSDVQSLPLGSGTTPNKESDVEMSLPVSSDDEGDEEEFDEDDFQASEEKYRLELSLIEAKRPPPLLQDHTIRSLLVRVQFLNMLLYDAIPTIKEEDTIMENATQPTQLSQTGLLSPDHMSEEQEERSEVQHPQPRGRPLSQAPINPIPTPPLEELLYLKREVLGHVVFEDSENEVQQEATTTLIRQEFESSAFEWQNGLDDLKADFKRTYIPWKQEILSLGQKERELQHSAKEEEERREREAAANSGPNLDTEAVIPAMLKPDEVRLNMFEDTNGLIPVDISLEVFAYIPPEDDFTEEEQLAFIQAYCQTPKKWGKIAEALQGRSYQECITHYYLTKNEAKYKEILRRSQPKRKRGRAVTKPRSTALMSELMYGEEAEGNVAVTDTGRPKRAAAPTFGDNGGDSDLGAPMPPTKRVAGNAKDSSGEAPAAKGGRGRKAGAGTKARRTKAQIQADQQAAALLLPAVAPDGSPQKALGTPRAERARTLLRPEDGNAKSVVAPPGSEPSRMPEVVDLQQYVLVDDPRDGHAGQSAGASHTKSYWSARDQKRFPELVARYGKDFTAIADCVKSKTVAMIRNYYNKQISDGNPELDELAKEADRRRAAGEPLHAPPSPATQTKRRYEASPSSMASVPRPAATSSESVFGEVERQALQSKTGYTDDFPSNAVQRNASGELIAKPRSSRDSFRESRPLATHTAKHEEGSKTSMFGQKPFGGPRSGIFKEEGAVFGVPAQNMHSVPHEPSSHQHPMRLNEYRGVDIVGSTLSGSPQQVPLGHLRDAAITATQTAGNVLGQIQPQSDKYGQIQPQADKYGQIQPQADKYGQIQPQADKYGQIQPQADKYGQIQPQADKYGVLGYQQQQSRNVNIGLGHAPPPLEKDATSGRRFDPAPRELPLTFARAQSPALAQVQPIEPAKPAPAKRSNIMSILNMDPEPPKRSSTDASNQPSVPSPQPTGINTQAAQYERRSDFRQEERSTPYGHDLRPQFGQPASLSATPQLHRDHSAGFSASPAPGPNDAWMARYDPRTQAPSSEPRTLHQSPRPMPYSLVPPGTQPETSQPVQGLRMEQQRSLDPADHRRSLLGQIGHPGNNPSPPPQAKASYRRTIATKYSRRTMVTKYSRRTIATKASRPTILTKYSRLAAIRTQQAQRRYQVCIFNTSSSSLSHHNNIKADPLLTCIRNERQCSQA